MSEIARSTSPSRSRWTQVKLRRVVVALLLIFACLGFVQLIIWFLEPWYFVHEMSQTDAHLGVTPTRLHDTSASALSPNRLEYFGFSYQSPWNTLEKQKVSKTSAVLFFKEGASIIVFDPAGTTGLSAAVHRQTKPLASVFGTRAMSSGYDWMASELAASPAEIHWWTRTNNVRLAVLLGMKSMEITSDCTAIYTVENPELHG